MLSLSRTWAVLVKEFIQLTRDRLTYAMILAMPVVQLLLFGYAINDDPRHLPTAVLVQDNSAFSRSVLSALQGSSYFDIRSWPAPRTSSTAPSRAARRSSRW
jgi:ABC-2 type transport system permease protein